MIGTECRQDTKRKPCEAGTCPVVQQEYNSTLPLSVFLNSARYTATQNPTVEIIQITTNIDVLKLVSNMMKRQVL